MVQRIPLSGKRAAGRSALVDDGDVPLVANYSWCVEDNGHGNEYVRAYVRGTGREGMKRVTMHQLIAGHPYVDHINGDGLDNQRHNLRPYVRGQNLATSGSRGGSSVYKGVSLHRDGWVARITVDYAVRHLGTYADEITAARAYDAAAREAWPEYAQLNFPH